MDLIVEKFKACLYGGAIGDALGAPVLALSREGIRRKFGPEGLVDYVPAYGRYGRLGAITSNTQMTLFTLEGLFRADLRFEVRGIVHMPSMVLMSYKMWYCSQAYRQPIPMLRRFSGYLLSRAELRHRRAPSRTCLVVLSEHALSCSLCPTKADNNSQGCAALTRSAPIGLYWFVDPFKCAVEVAQITHGHVNAQIAAGFFALVIHQLRDGDSLSVSLDKAFQKLAKYPQSQEMLAALQAALTLAKDESIAPEDAIARLGLGWTAAQALAIAIYCSLKAKSFPHGVLLAVNHDGNSAGTAALTGHILGLIYGLAGVPERWRTELEVKDLIEEMSMDKYLVGKADSYSKNDDFDLLLKKYPC
ncbi:MAG: ADP-ribosylglycohydrolase family protein [Deltaproteobacteria bacterium]|jgi:ADP-ribosylglycohydrolase|nr:ADP-ribosylglycohydrolase family protein [Deltaproteobacteria bacterium]